MWTMPCLPRRAVEERDAELRAALAQLLDHRVRQRVGVGLAHLVRRDDVVHRRERAVRHGHLEAQVAHHAEGLRARDLVDQVGADEELRLAVRQRAHGVGVPDFLEEGFGHGSDYNTDCIVTGNTCLAINDA